MIPYKTAEEKTACVNYFASLPDANLLQSRIVFLNARMLKLENLAYLEAKRRGLL